MGGVIWTQFGVLSRVLVTYISGGGVDSVLRTNIYKNIDNETYLGKFI